MLLVHSLLAFIVHLKDLQVDLDLVEVTGPVVSGPLDKDRLDQQPIAVQVVLHAPVVKLHLVIDTPLGEDGAPILIVPVWRNPQEALLFFSAERPFWFNGDQRLLSPAHVFNGLPQPIGYRIVPQSNRYGLLPGGVKLLLVREVGDIGYHYLVRSSWLSQSLATL